MAERVVDGLLAGPPARQGGPGHRAVKPDQGKTPAGGEREGGLRHPGHFQSLEREIEDVARVGVGERGPVVVELGEAGDEPAPAEESVLGQVDIVLALQLTGSIGEIRDGD